MTKAVLSKKFHALCYEHHLEMKPIQLPATPGEPSAPTSTYSCQQASCLVHYAPSNGYFVVPKKNGRPEAERMPRVRCLRDSQWMYLAEVNPEKQDFRLWRCPQCDATQTNEGHLVNVNEAPPKT